MMKFQEVMSQTKDVDLTDTTAEQTLETWPRKLSCIQGEQCLVQVTFSEERTEAAFLAEKFEILLLPDILQVFY